MTDTAHDGLNREISYLRISVTDRCNLRCVYCMPEDGVPALDHEQVLRFEEIVRLVRLGTRMGIRQVRLTGGEPLARKGIVDLVRMIRGVPGIGSISMTTNGTMLAPLARQLADAGLTRVNLSLDTLQSDRFTAITRRGRIEDAFAGIQAALDTGLTPVKVNMVVMQGVNEDEVVAFAQQTLSQPWNVRFIEFMPLGDQASLARRGYVSSETTRERIESALGPLTAANIPGAGPAQTWRLEHAAGTVGFISALSQHFCATCNRMRLTSDGKLIPCLFNDREYDLRTAMRDGADDARLIEIWQEALANKPPGHTLDQAVTTTGHRMSRIGG